MKKTQISLLLLAALVLTTACQNSNDDNQETSDSTILQTDETTEAVEYDYTDKNFDGYKFRILSIADAYSMHMEFDRSETNGEYLNDAIYERNRLVESKLNITIDENVIGGGYNESTPVLINTIRQSVEADDDICDIAFISPDKSISLVTSGYFYDLKNYDGFQFDKLWYNQGYNDAVTLNGKLFFGMSDATIGLTDGIWALFFNEDMMADYKLDLPYDLVREGKWTIDKLNEYTLAVGSLNGDESFDWSKSGNSIYGLSIGTNSPMFMSCMGEWYVENNGKDLTLTVGTERFYNAYEKLLKLLDRTSGSAYFGVENDYDADNGGYMYPFSVQRALFETCEVCKTAGFRNFDFTYGIAPFPKLDESQDRYYSYIFQGALAFSIPVTCRTPEKSAEIFDAFAYEGMKSVVPVYRSVTLEQKGLRNDDSIEMLGIITNSAVCNIGQMFGITTSFYSSIHSDMRSGNNTASSLVASNKESMEAAMKETIEILSELK